jgi:protein involved in polysaccharide export with SLBB domain
MVRIKISSLVLRLAAAVVWMFSGAGLSSDALAQTPTAEQLQIFQTLTPDQQRSILETLGKGVPGGVRVPEAIPDRALDFPDVVNRPRTPEEQARLSGVPGEIRLKGADSLLISLKLREFKEADQPIELPGVNPATPTPGAAPSAAELRQPPQARERIVRADEDTAKLNDFRERILRRNPYVLDKWGILNVLELGPIPLGGLTPQEATQRLAAEPRLADFIVQITYLPVKAIGAQGLQPFGYDLFTGAPSTFAPATDVPVPAEYVLGPGDTFEVQLFGNTKGRYSLVVGRDGQINFPELGPISVGGMRFAEAARLLQQRVSEQMIGTQASVHMGEMRSIRVFVLGDANFPGSYTVSGLSTITNALFVSGGVKPIGSLRNIELKRAGRTVTRLDLYDLLLHGDTSHDLRLLAGDVIFIPPAERVVGVTGEVRRPALYELRGETSVADLVTLAGGLTMEADAALATLERIDPERQRVVQALDVRRQGAQTAVRGGDVLTVPTIRPTVEDSVVVTGHVFRPGTYAFHTGMRLSQVIASLQELKPGADQHYVLIRREVPPTRRVEFVSADLVRALEQPGGAADVPLAARDQVFVFDLETGRGRLLDPLMREIEQQSTQSEPSQEVSVSGRVNVPGTYPLERGMRVSDLVRAGGSLNEAAYGGTAELTRSVSENGEARRTVLQEIDLAKALAGDPQHDLALQPFDQLVVKELPLWAGQEYVQVMGEVRFPGRYPIQRGETLRSLVQRAGGLTDFAFAPGSVFTRVTLQERERKQLDDLTRRMQTDLAQLSLMTAQEARGDAAQALAVGQQLLQDLHNAEPVGRLVFNLDASMNAQAGASDDIVLKDGDRLLIPRVTQEVTVIGEVQSPTSHLYTKASGRDDYIDRSGGLTQRADKGRIYVVRADGSVVSNRGAAWFGGSGAIQPGDTIVVPLDAERMRPLPLWTAVTTIIYNLAVAVAAVNSF